MSAAKTASAGPRYHYFWAGTARTHGVNAAIVYKHMDFLSRCVAKGGPVEVNIRKLAQHYPYLTPSTVHRSVLALTQERRGGKPLLVPERLPGSRHLRYRVNGPAQARQRLVALDTAVAAEHGVVAGFVYASIVRRILREWVAGDGTSHPSVDVNDNGPTVSALVDRHAWSVPGWHRWHTFISFRTVRRGFERLVRAGLLVKRGRKFVWSPPPPGCAFYVPLPHRPGAESPETVLSMTFLDDEIVVVTE